MLLKFAVEWNIVCTVYWNMVFAVDCSMVYIKCIQIWSHGIVINRVAVRIEQIYQSK